MSWANNDDTILYSQKPRCLCFVWAKNIERGKSRDELCTWPPSCWSSMPVPWYVVCVALGWPHRLPDCNGWSLTPRPRVALGCEERVSLPNDQHAGPSAAPPCAPQESHKADAHVGCKGSICCGRILRCGRRIEHRSVQERACPLLPPRPSCFCCEMSLMHIVSTTTPDRCLCRPHMPGMGWILCLCGWYRMLMHSVGHARTHGVTAEEGIFFWYPRASAGRGHRFCPGSGADGQYTACPTFGGCLTAIWRSSAARNGCNISAARGYGNVGCGVHHGTGGRWINLHASCTLDAPRCLSA